MPPLGPLSALLVPRHLTRVLILVTGAALLLVLVISPEGGPGWVPVRGPARGASEGRHRGRLISELWAEGLPEQAWFAGDARCAHLVTRFTRDRELPLVYLASLPRSGNTWVRYLLEAATGLFTCVGGPEYHQYRNASSRNASRTPEQIWQVSRKGFNQWVDFGYLGELLNWTQGNTLVARSQTWPQPWSVAEANRIDDTLQHPMAAFPADRPRRAVLIIRDPFHEFISWKKYDHTHNMVNEGDMSDLYRGAAWHQFVVYYAHVWYELYSRWIRFTDDTHVLHYHRLTSEPMAELERLLPFLEVQPDPVRLECVRAHLEGRVHSHRHGVVPDNETYPTLLRAEVWSHIHQLNQDLKARGRPPLPLQSYAFAEEFADIGL